MEMFLKPICFIENGHGNKVQSQLLCNLCYWNSGWKVATRILTVKSYGTNFLNVLVENILIQYNINKGHVISIVTDNLSNIIKNIDKLNERK